MPFRSKSQMRYLAAKEPKVFEDWKARYGVPKNLPEKVGEKPVAKKKAKKYPAKKKRSKSADNRYKYRQQYMKKKFGKAHPGFEAIARDIARKQKVPIERARKILASRTRSASVGAKRRNPRLKKVKG